MYSKGEILCQIDTGSRKRQFWIFWGFKKCWCHDISIIQEGWSSTAISAKMKKSELDHKEKLITIYGRILWIIANRMHKCFWIDCGRCFKLEKWNWKIFIEITMWFMSPQCHVHPPCWDSLWLGKNSGHCPLSQCCWSSSDNNCLIVQYNVEEGLSYI